jgi:hypothetical protein
MFRSRTCLALLVLPFALSTLAACGDDAPAGDVDSGITLFDAPVVTPDAAPPPDAFECSANNCDDECCDNICIDTSADDQNCGACNEACTVGTHCESDGELVGCGECPESFVPAAIADADGTVLDLRPLADFPAFAGFSQFQDPVDDSIQDGFGIIYPKTGVVLGQEYPLTVGLSLPVVLAVYDGNLLAQSYDTAYGATEGTLVFTSATATCVSGSITGATFAALDSALPPSVAADGCEFPVADFTFSIGDCEVVDFDAGVGGEDAGGGA